MFFIDAAANEQLSKNNLPTNFSYRRAFESGYKFGMREGVKTFAWWKNGIQYVGSGNYTLEQALKEIDEL